MSVKKNLIAAKALIADESKWGKGAYEDPDSGCLCAFGAVMKIRLGRVKAFEDNPSDEDFALMRALPDVAGGASRFSGRFGVQRPSRHNPRRHHGSF